MNLNEKLESLRRPGSSPSGNKKKNFGSLLLLLAFLVGMALTGNLWGLLAAYLLLQLASNTAHGPAQGLIPDLVDADRRGVASGIKNLFDMSGLVVTSLDKSQSEGSEEAGEQPEETKS